MALAALAAFALGGAALAQGGGEGSEDAVVEGDSEDSSEK